MGSTCTSKSDNNEIKPEIEKTKMANQHDFMQSLYMSLGLTDKPSPKEIATLFLLGIMLLLFIISLTGFFIMWFTEYYNNLLFSNIILVDGSDAAKSWVNPNPKYDTLLKVHIFNYTNIDQFMSGRNDKIIVKDIGPFVYKEHTQKVNVSFNKNYTVSFRDSKSFKFLPEKSVCSVSEKLMVPNVPLLTAAVKINKMNFFKKSFGVFIIKSFRESLFKLLPAEGYLWGYEDRIAGLGEGIGTGNSRFGLLMNRNGTSVDSLQMNTGEDEFLKFGTITQFNGLPELDFWNDKECNRIDGNDATTFSPHLLKSRKSLFVFLQVLCRKIPLHFEKDITLYKNINALRYRTPNNVFGSPKENRNNTCYCHNTEACMPSGIINATKCYNDAPIFPSFPHFFTGDPILYKYIDGIYPNSTLHQTYADIHPRFAFPISGASRIQINIRVDKIALKNLIKTETVRRFYDEMFLPLIWIEITSSDPTDEIIEKLYISTVGLDAIQLALKYGTLLISLISFCLIVSAYMCLTRDKVDSSKAIEFERQDKLHLSNMRS